VHRDTEVVFVSWVQVFLLLKNVVEFLALHLLDKLTISIDQHQVHLSRNE
jgi:hypothetical protein